MNPDFVALLSAFTAGDVRFLVVGAYALGVHGRPRATGDLDVWVEATPENAARVIKALTEFGAPLQGVSEADFSHPGCTYQIGIVPIRIDILTELTGLNCAEAWAARLRRLFGPIEVDYIGREAFIHNKKASGRPKDLVDIEGFES